MVDDFGPLCILQVISLLSQQIFYPVKNWGEQLSNSPEDLNFKINSISITGDTFLSPDPSSSLLLPYTKAVVTIRSNPIFFAGGNNIPFKHVHTELTPKQTKFSVEEDVGHWTTFPV